MPISSKKSLNKLSEEVSICKQCLDLVKTRKRPVPGTGAPNSRLIIVGYFPGDGPISLTRDRESILMRSMIKDAGLSLESDTYLTYLVKCIPREIRGGDKNNSTKDQQYEPTQKHISNCINYLTEEISVITPHIIVSLGLDVSNVILKNFFSANKQHNDISKIHMRLFENPSFKLVPLFSLKDVINGKISESKYFEDFRTLSRLFVML